MQFKWWKLQKGMGIRVKISNDIDNQTGKQKYRPAIVIKSYPSHVKVQLMTTEPSSHDYFKIKINNQIQYIRPIYYKTIKFNEIGNIWKDKFNNPIQLDKSSNLFTKIQEMEIKENLGYEINLNQKIKLETKIQKLEKENQQLKNKIELFKNSNLKNRNHG
ncbi:MAG: hypothetical protein PPFGHCPK_01356 (plasmid) [Spiroplasma endosymbiont of Drosophila atripex]|nr:MAG: hypothetical protein PPFGHCPK_01356 [Spiroplasma endosymbiont of Drosophila atripex]